MSSTHNSAPCSQVHTHQCSHTLGSHAQYIQCPSTRIQSQQSRSAPSAAALPQSDSHTKSNADLSEIQPQPCMITPMTPQLAPLSSQPHDDARHHAQMSSTRSRTCCAALQGACTLLLPPLLRPQQLLRLPPCLPAVLACFLLLLLLQSGTITADLLFTHVGAPTASVQVLQSPEPAALPHSSTLMWNALSSFCASTLTASSPRPSLSSSRSSTSCKQTHHNSRRTLDTRTTCTGLTRRPAYQGSTPPATGTNNLRAIILYANCTATRKDP